MKDKFGKVTMSFKYETVREEKNRLEWNESQVLDDDLPDFHDSEDGQRLMELRELLGE